LLMIAVFWTIDAADSDSWLVDYISKEGLENINITIARAVLAVAFAAGFATFIFAKPCVSISVGSAPVQGEKAGKGQGASKPQVTILGFANVHGSRYFLLLPCFILAISLLLPPMGQFSMAICSWQILALLEILDTNSLTTSGTSASAIGPVVLAMLGSYHFFKTGHQAVLSSIQWNAAFVPLRTIQHPWSALLIVFNSFGAQILCAAAVPLTVLWKRPLGKGGLRGIWGDVLQAVMVHMLYYAIIQLATTLWAAHLRRHLMLYRVFMPRFLMASMVLVIMDVVLIIVALVGVRISADKVGQVFGH